MFSNTKSYLSYLNKKGESISIEDCGKKIPVISNMLNSEASINHLLNEKSHEEIRENLSLIESFLSTNEESNAFRRLVNVYRLKRLNRLFPSKYSGTAPCHESVQYNAKLLDLPFKKDDSDIYPVMNNAVIFYNDQITGKRIIESFAIHITSDKTISIFDSENTELERNIANCTHALPVAICIGGNPILSIIAKGAYNIDKLTLSGLLQSDSIKMTSAITQTVMIPAESDIVIEGYIKKSGERVQFGNYCADNGETMNKDNCPVINVTCITHRHDAILTNSFGTEFMNTVGAFEALCEEILPEFIKTKKIN